MSTYNIYCTSALLTCVWITCGVKKQSWAAVAETIWPWKTSWLFPEEYSLSF